MWLITSSEAAPYAAPSSGTLGDDEESLSVSATQAEQGSNKLRGFTETCYAAARCTTERRVIARFEAMTLGFDARHIVSTLTGEARHLYDNS